MEKMQDWAPSSAWLGAAHPCGIRDVRGQVPAGIPGSWCHPRERGGQGGGLGPARSPEDKRLLIAMATNERCVVTALLSPWQRTESHIATCASRSHGNGPVALEHPLLDLCSGSWWWDLSRADPSAAGRWGWGQTGEGGPKGCRKSGALWEPRTSGAPGALQ